MTIGVSTQIGGLLYVENLLTNHIEVYKSDRHVGTITSDLSIPMLKDVIHNRSSVRTLRERVDKYLLDAVKATKILETLASEKRELESELSVMRLSAESNREGISLISSSLDRAEKEANNGE